MRRIPSVGLMALLGTGACYSYADPSPPYPEWSSSFVSGPPGGAMDPGYGYQDPIYMDPPAPGTEGAAQPADPGGFAPGSEPGAAVAPGEEGAPAEAGDPMAGGEAPAPSTDPTDPGYAIGSVTDAEIDTTLSPYGQWIETEEYGRVWRPDATVVGVDFTPYETCGTWVYTDYGWTFNCDWDWGWLPFHYGQWTWIDDGWSWVRDYTWSPAWVEWRSGGGYVGWRPLAPRVRDHRRYPGGGSSGGPIVRDHRDHRHPRGSGGSGSGGGGPIVRDHRDGKSGVIVRDHRRPRESDWRFAHERDFGRTRIRPGLYRNVAEGIRITSAVSRPPVRGTRVSAAEVMRPRIKARYGSRMPAATGRQTGRVYQQPGRTGYPSSRPSRPSVGTYSPPGRGGYQPPIYRDHRAPSGGSYSPPSRGSYSPPSRGSYSSPLRRDHRAPSRGSYSPPSRGSYSSPSRSSSSSSRGSSYSPPSRSSSSSSRGSSYSPSRSSSSGSRGSSSSSSRSSGGGRRR